ncbi:MAG: hypothetical protein L6R35_005099 [Caloplaca aegaea]|nr:MAG: hypothetical protein L6R35_005099 [Caloplaca aegaea]
MGPQTAPPPSTNVSVQQFILRTLSQQPHPPGWQTSVQTQFRANIVFQIFSSLRLLQSSFDLHHQLNLAMGFENKAFTESPDRNIYEQQCKSKMGDIHEVRTKQAASTREQMNMQRNLPQHPQHMGQAMAHNQTQGHIQFQQGQPNPQQQQMMQFQGMPMQQQPQQPGRQQQAVPGGPRPPPVPQGQQSASHQMLQPQPQQYNPTAEENQQINRIAQQLYNSTPPHRLEAIQNNLRQMSAEQRENLNRHGVEPMTYFFRSQATKKFLEMKRAQTSGQRGPAAQSGAVNGMTRPPQNMARPGGQQAPAPQQSFETPFDQIIGQQQDGLRSQEAGQVVVPASNPQANLDQRNAARINAQQQLNMQNGGNHPLQNAPANHPQATPFWTQQHGQRNVNPSAGVNGHSSAAGFSNVTQAPANVLQGQPGGLDNQITRTPSQTPGMPNLNKAAAPPGQTPNMWPQRTPQMGQGNHQGAPLIQQPVQQPTERSEAPQKRPPFLQNLPPRIQQHLANLPEEGRRAFLMDLQRRQVANQHHHQMQQQQLQQQQQAAQQAAKAAGSRATMNDSFPMSSQPSQPGMQTGPIATMAGRSMAVSQPTMPKGNDVQPAFAPPHSAFGGPARQQPGSGQQPPQQRGTTQYPGSNANPPPPLTKEQARQMDQSKFPVNLLSRQMDQIPQDVESWGQLKDWVIQNAPSLPPNTLQKLEHLQALQYRAHQQESRPPQPGNLPTGAAQPQAPFAQMVSHPSVQAPVSASRPPNGMNVPQFTSQDIQATRASLPEQFQNVSDDQIRAFMVRNKPNLAARNVQQTPSSQTINGTGTPQGQGVLGPSDPPQPPQTNQPKPPGQQPQKGAGPASKQGQGTRNASVNKPPQKGIKRNSNDEDVVEVPKPNPSKSQVGAQNQSSAPPMKQRPQAPEPKAQMNAKHSTNQNLPDQSPNAGSQNAGPPGMPNMSREEVARRDARLRQLGNELSLNQPPRRPVPMTAVTRAQMSQKLKELSQMVSRLDASLPAFFRNNPNEAVTRRLIDMRNKIKAQYRDKHFNLVDQFTISPQELEEAFSSIKEYFMYIMSKFSKRITNGSQPGEQQQNQQQSQRPPINQEKAPLSTVNLTEHQNMLQAERQANMQKHAGGHGSRIPAAPTSDKPPFPLGSQSPHGTPTAYGPQKLNADQLVLPQHKRRKSNHPPSAGSTPVPAQEASMSRSSPLVPKLASPGVPRAAVPHMSFKCGVSDCLAGQRGFASQAELEQHNTDEHERKEADIEDPVEFCLEAVRDALGLDEKGQSLPRKETLEAPKMKTSLSAQSEKVVRQEASTPMARASTQTGPSPGSNFLKTPQAMSGVRTPASDAGFAVREGKGKDAKGPTPLPKETSPPPVDPWAGSYISADAITSNWSSLADMQSLSFTKIQMSLTPSSSGNDKSEKNSPRPSDISENDVVKINLGIGGDEKNGWVPGEWFEDSLYSDIESMHFGADQLIGDVDWDVFGDLSDTEMADVPKGRKRMEDVVSEEWLKVYAPEKLRAKKRR